MLQRTGELRFSICEKWILFVRNFIDVALHRSSSGALGKCNVCFLLQTGSSSRAKLAASPKIIEALIITWVVTATYERWTVLGAIKN